MKRILVFIILLTFCFALPILAQSESDNADKFKKFVFGLKSRPKAEKVSEEQSKAVCQQGFVGEGINLNVVNTDVSDILNYITEEYGFTFEVDKNLKLNPVTKKVENEPWNLVLAQILKEQDLDIQCIGNLLRISEVKTLFVEKPTLYTEFIELKNITIKSIGEEILGDTVNPIFDEKGNIFIDLIEKKLTHRGSVEVGHSNKGAVLIVTDEKENLKAVIEYIKLLDVC